jgi:replicative DNA helicase
VIDFDRIPPQDIGAETCVLGGMMLQPAAVAKAAGLLVETDFYRPAHVDLFRVMLGMQAARQPIDLVTLKDALSTAGLLERVGGIEYVGDIVDGVPDAANVEYYANIVRDASIKRELIAMATEIIADGYAKTEIASDLLKKYQTRLYEIHRMAKPKRGQEATLGQAVRTVMADLEDRYLHGKTASARWNTGFDAIDDAIHGLRPGHLITLAAATGAGKTTLAMNIAACVAGQGAGVLFVSGEMLPPELAQRVLQAYSGISGNAIHSAQLRPDDWTCLNDAEAVLKALPCHIVGRAMDLAGIALKAQQVASQWQVPIGLVVVDYLQIMHLPPGREMRERIGAMTSGLKQLAMDLQCPVMMLSQFNREEAKSKKPPSLYGLKESGSIENDSNVVVLLHKPEPVQLWHDSEGQAWVVVWAQVAKARDGKTTRWPDGQQDEGGIKLLWQPNRTRFASMPE